MARQEGFEPPTYCLEGSCSIRMSYWRMVGAGDGNRTRVPSLEGWCPGRCATPADSRHKISSTIIAYLPTGVKAFSPGDAQIFSAYPRFSGLPAAENRRKRNDFGTDTKGLQFSSGGGLFCLRILWYTVCGFLCAGSDRREQYRQRNGRYDGIAVSRRLDGGAARRRAEWRRCGLSWI